MNRRQTTAVILASLAFGSARADQSRLPTPAPASDLSGLSWIEGERFLAVHDAKNPEEIDLPRVSVLALPSSLEGVLWYPAGPVFPQTQSSDLEGIARIPGTTNFLLAESGDDAGPFDRIFLAELRGERIEILGTARWRDFTTYYNIEAIAVAPTAGGERIFLWAERSSGQASTELKWTRLSVEPFRIGGSVASVSFTLPASASDTGGKPLYNRPIVALEVDSVGRIYIAATLDPEEFSPSPDNGPFRSILYRIGRVMGDDVVLDPNPAVVASLDGLKVESLAIRERGGVREIFVGTDDENYGGILRALPMRGDATR